MLKGSERGGAILTDTQCMMNSSTEFTGESAPMCVMEGGWSQTAGGHFREPYCLGVLVSKVVTHRHRMWLEASRRHKTAQHA